SEVDGDDGGFAAADVDVAAGRDVEQTPLAGLVDLIPRNEIKPPTARAHPEGERPTPARVGVEHEVSDDLRAVALGPRRRRPELAADRARADVEDDESDGGQDELDLVFAGRRFDDVRTARVRGREAHRLVRGRPDRIGALLALSAGVVPVDA